MDQAFSPLQFFRQVGIHDALEMGPLLGGCRKVPGGREDAESWTVRMSRDEGQAIQGPQGLRLDNGDSRLGSRKASTVRPSALVLREVDSWK